MFGPDRTNHHPAAGEIPAGASEEHWNLLEIARADFTPCPHWSHDSDRWADNPRVMVMSAGGGIGDILDESNAYALTALAEGWEEIAPEVIYVHHGMYDWTYVCISLQHLQSLEEEGTDLLASIISTAEHFDDYPVLDESDYSEREWNAFAECFGDESARIMGDDYGDHPLFFQAAEYAQEHYLGYSDPGYISEEHVRESWTTVGAEIPTDS